MGLFFRTPSRRPAPRAAGWPTAFRPRLEQLMDRVVPSVTADFLGGVLTVTSNGDADVVSIQSNAATGQHEVFANGALVRVVPLAATSKIEVFGNGGADTVNVGLLNPDNLGFRVVIDGGAGDDAIVGSRGKDSLLGGANNDAIDGGFGDDVIDGGEGDDAIRGNAGTDTLFGGGGLLDVVREEGNADFTLTSSSLNAGATLGTDSLGGFERAELTGGRSANTLTALGFNGPVTLTGLGGNDVLIGGVFADALFGGDGLDRLEGNGGSDLLAGGADNDAYLGGSGTDTAVEVVDIDVPGTDVIRLTSAAVTVEVRDNTTGAVTGVGTDSLNSIERAELTTLGGVGEFHIETTSVAAKVVGSAGLPAQLFAAVPDNATLSDNLLDRTGASDIELVNIRRVELTGSEADNVISALAFSKGSTVISGAGGNDTLTGGVFTFSDGDILNGGEGDDVFIATAGLDHYRGDAGTDRVEAVFVKDALLDDTQLNARNEGVIGISARLTSIERATLTGNDQPNEFFATNFTGSATLIGGGGDDLLVGGSGGDNLQGGPGNDTLQPNGGGNVVDGGADTDTIVQLTSTGDTTLTDQVLTSGSTFTLLALGTIEKADLRGSNIDARDFTGDATLRGSGGTLRGGSGNDSLIGGAAADQLFGNEGNDTLEGSGGDDLLDGGLGDDLLDGGGGNDTIRGGGPGARFGDRLRQTVLGNSTTTITPVTGKFAVAEFRLVTVPVSGTTTTDLLTGIHAAEISVSSGTNTIDASGATFPVTLNGGSGADALVGGSAADVLNGNGGEDNLQGGFGADTLNGGDQNDTLFGNRNGTGGTFADGAPDALNGDDGDDDILAVVADGDVADEGRGVGGIVIPGTDGDDIIVVRRRVGPAGPEVVVVMNGVESSSLYRNGETIRVNGGKGNDIIVLDESTAVTWSGKLFGGDGHDLLVGASRGDYLDGGNGRDTLYGLAGDDTLIGGAGRDELRGGAGADIISALDGVADLIYVDAYDFVAKDKKDIFYWE